MRRVITLVTVLIAALACAVAVAATTQTTYSQKYATTHLGQATGMTVRWSARSTNGGMPAQPKTVTLTFPVGNQWSSPPANTKIGSGMATFEGIPRLPITVYTRQSPSVGLTLVISNPVGMTVRIDTSFTHMGAQLVIPIPKFDVPPAVLTGVSLAIKSGVRTPRGCPSSGAWKFSAAFAYPSGVQTLNSTTACRQHLT